MYISRKTILENLEAILAATGFEASFATSTEIRGCCPIHDGDNMTSFVMYPSSGRWYCHTRQCHANVPINDIRSIVYNYLQNNDLARTRDDIDRFINEAIVSNKGVVRREAPVYKRETIKIPVQEVKDKIIPDTWFLQFGFTEETLDKFMIGYSSTYGDPMYNRAYAPILDATGKYVIGFTGRITIDKCELCGSYHNKKKPCPTDGGPRPWPKWKHFGLSTREHLYNIDKVDGNDYIILVEGPKNVWWLDQNGIKNSLAVLGSGLKKPQAELIKGIGPKKIYLLFDNDDAGRIYTTKAQSLLEKFEPINVSFVLEDNNDIADCGEKEINRLKRILHVAEDLCGVR